MNNKESLNNNNYNNGPKLSLHFLTMSNKYLWLCKNIMEEIVKRGNPWQGGVYNGGDVENVLKKYQETIKWSDFNIIMPLLFIFYHGLELLLKAFLLFKSSEFKPNHKIKTLLKDFKREFKDEVRLCDVLNKYLTLEQMPPYLRKHLEENNLSVGDLYNNLRYPADKNFKNICDYFQLKYQEKRGLKFFNELKEDLELLLFESVSLSRKLEKSHQKN